MEETVTCYHISMIKASEEQRADVNEYITRANYGLTNGNFEMDFNDGELRYKTNISCYDLLGDDSAALKRMIFLVSLGPSMWSRYGDNLAALLFGFTGGKTIKELVQESESSD